MELYGVGTGDGFQRFGTGLVFRDFFVACIFEASAALESDSDIYDYRMSIVCEYQIWLLCSYRLDFACNLASHLPFFAICEPQLYLRACHRSYCVSQFAPLAPLAG